MKKSILWVAAGIVAGTAAFMLSKRKKNTTPSVALDDSNKSRHRTTVFSKTKNYG
ncbi:MAG TPA: hypothetical protein VLR49_08460 [Ferruginibacter sp.]|nr:hypothetical protein [Ferruginibacter sp.]